MAGVNLTMRAETTAVLAKAGMLTPDGRCKTLDASADGYARGEACVVSPACAIRPLSSSDKWLDGLLLSGVCI